MAPFRSVKCYSQTDKSMSEPWVTPFKMEQAYGKEIWSVPDIRSMACNSHSLHTAHPHPPIQVTSSWPCPMARNLSLSALNSDLSASFMRSLTGSEPGLRMKTTGEKGVLCCRMASKLITGGCTYLQRENPTVWVIAQSSCTGEQSLAHQGLSSPQTAHGNHSDTAPALLLRQTTQHWPSWLQLQLRVSAVLGPWGQRDSRLAHCHCHIVHHRPVHPVHTEAAQQEKLLEVCDIALVVHWQWDLLQSICVIPLARKDSTNEPSGSVREMTGKEKINLMNEGPRDTMKTKKVNQLQINIKNSGKCEKSNFFSMKYSSPETDLYFHFMSTNSLKI